MHDLSFANQIISALKNKAKNLPDKTKIIAVNAALSPLSHVLPKTLTETFSTIAEGTEFESVALNIKALPIKVICHTCKHSFQVDKPTTECARCNGLDLDIVHTNEFSIESILTETREK